MRAAASLRNRARPDSPPPYFSATGVAIIRKNVLICVAKSAPSRVRSLLAPASSHFSSTCSAFEEASDKPACPVSRRCSPSRTSSRRAGFTVSKCTCSTSSGLKRFVRVSNSRSRQERIVSPIEPVLMPSGMR